jgi:hypothetical protein
VEGRSRERVLVGGDRILPLFPFSLRRTRAPSISMVGRAHSEESSLLHRWSASWGGSVEKADSAVPNGLGSGALRTMQDTTHNAVRQPINTISAPADGGHPSYQMMK